MLAIAKFTELCFEWTLLALNRIHQNLSLFLLVVVLATAGFWGVNVLWLKEINFIPLFVVTLLIVVHASRPKTLLAFMAAGGIAYGLQKNTSIAQGMKHGLEVWYRVTFGVLFGFGTIFLILATYSFKESPGSFWAIIAGILILTVMGSYFGLKSQKTVVRSVTAYVLVVMVVAAWTTIPSTWNIKKVATRASSGLSVSAIESSRWDDSKAMFDPTTGESLFWVGAEHECPYGTPGHSTYNGQKLKKGTYEEAKRFRTEQFDHCFEDKAKGKKEASVTTATWTRSDPDCLGLGTWNVQLASNEPSRNICFPKSLDPKVAPYGIDVDWTRSDQNVPITFLRRNKGRDLPPIIWKAGSENHIRFPSLDSFRMIAPKEVVITVKMMPTAS